MSNYRYSEARRLGLPRHDTRPWPLGLLAYGPEQREAGRALILRALDVWRAAGSPGLVACIVRTQQLLHAIAVFAEDRHVARERVEEILNIKEEAE